MSQILKDYRLDPEYLICKYISILKKDDDDSTIITNSVININYSDDDVIQIKVNNQEDFEQISTDKSIVTENTKLLENESVKIISDEDYNKYKQLFDKFEKGFNIIENVKKWFIKIFNLIKKMFIKT